MEMEKEKYFKTANDMIGHNLGEDITPMTKEEWVQWQRDVFSDCLLPEKNNKKTYAVTGTFHGSIIEATSEGEARRIFHQAWNGESITHVKVCSAPAALF